MTFQEHFPTESEFVSYIESASYICSISWVTGGQYGGSCWGDDPRSMESEEEPEFDVMYDILEEVFPELSFLQYRRLLKSDVIEWSTETCREYYGNYTIYAKKTIRLDRLYQFLVSL